MSSKGCCPFKGPVAGLAHSQLGAGQMCAAGGLPLQRARPRWGQPRKRRFGKVLHPPLRSPVSIPPSPFPPLRSRCEGRGGPAAAGVRGVTVRARTCHTAGTQAFGGFLVHTYKRIQCPLRCVKDDSSHGRGFSYVTDSSPDWFVRFSLHRQWIGCRPERQPRPRVLRLAVITN